jgi:catechol 2,3-dioxygenase-like lactoylglutathione lyase family enzyme
MPELDMRLEVVVLPVTDMDRAKEFYVDKVGFNLDVDHDTGEGFRVIQMTPPGSACSVSLVKGPGAPEMEPGSLKGLQITTTDVRAVRETLASHGVEVSEIQAFVQAEGRFVPAEGELEVFNAFVFFDDPDGNGWAIQQGPAKE